MLPKAGVWMIKSRQKSFLSRLGKIKALLDRLPFWYALRWLVARGISRWLEPELISSYSQFGEDRLVDALFGVRKTGIYVDVGCNHPVALSNTWKLYLRGWHGVAIDANPFLIKQYAKVRLRDVALAHVISNSDEQVEFFVPHVSNLIGGIGEKTSGYWQRTRDNSDVFESRSSRLSEILRTHDIPLRFDFLTIDTEGNELDVLLSLDLGEFLPDLIAVEIHDFKMSSAHESAVYNLLMENGYEVVSWIHPTVFFRQLDSR